MANLEAVKDWAKAFHSSCLKHLSLHDMPEVIVQAFAAYERPQAPKPEPKPLKLEAGCRVNRGAVIAVLDNRAWVKEDGCNRPLTYIFTNLTVTEAATPEVRDYVQLDPERGFKPVACIITAVFPCTSSGDRAYWDYEVRSGGDAPGADTTLVKRDDFTILHKAPKE